MEAERTETAGVLGELRLLLSEAQASVLLFAVALMTLPIYNSSIGRWSLLIGVLPVGARVIRKRTQYTPVLLSRDLLLALSVVSLIYSPARYVSFLGLGMALLSLTDSQFRVSVAIARDRLA